MRVAVCGAYAGGLQALRAVSQSGCEITLVATPQGQMEQFARKLGARIVPASEVKNTSFAKELRSSRTDLLISAQLPFLVCREALEAPRIGSFNLHPSLLPKYAGLHPTSWAIYRGEKEHGVTLHWMTSDVDAGPIIFQKAVRISETDTPPILLRKCFQAGMPLVSELIGTAANGDVIPRILQDLSHREYFGKEPPADGQIDWSRPAREIVNLARAFDYRPFASPWGYLMTEVLGSKIAVLKVDDSGAQAKAAPGTAVGDWESGLRIAASDHWVLITEYLK